MSAPPAPAASSSGAPTDVREQRPGFDALLADAASSADDAPAIRVDAMRPAPTGRPLRPLVLTPAGTETPPVDVSAVEATPVTSALVAPEPTPVEGEAGSSETPLEDQAQPADDAPAVVLPPAPPALVAPERPPVEGEAGPSETPPLEDQAQPADDAPALVSPAPPLSPAVATATSLVSTLPVEGASTGSAATPSGETAPPAVASAEVEAASLQLQLSIADVETPASAQSAAAEALPQAQEATAANPQPMPKAPPQNTVPPPILAELSAAGLRLFRAGARHDDPAATAPEAAPAAPAGAETPKADKPAHAPATILPIPSPRLIAEPAAAATSNAGALAAEPDEAAGQPSATAAASPSHADPQSIVERDGSAPSDPVRHVQARAPALAAETGPPSVKPASIETATTAAPNPIAPATFTPATPTSSALGLSHGAVETTALLAAQIAHRLSGRATRFEMGLTPEGLGRVDVSLEIDRDGQLTARLAFDNPLAATELRGRADELRRQLEAQGFTLAQDALDFSSRGDRQEGGSAFSRHQDRAFAEAARRQGRIDADLAERLSAALSPAAFSASTLTPRGVDMRV